MNKLSPFLHIVSYSCNKNKQYMWWKKRHNQKEQPRRMPGATRLFQLVLTAQRKWAAWMGSKASRWSRRQTKLYLAIFCAVIGGTCVHILIQAFSGQPSIRVSTHDKISILPMGQAMQRVEFTELEAARISGFIRYLDSLQTTPTGMQMYLELARNRPGLIDSLQTIRQFLKP
ncbi:hypothetical protein [Chitinophaga tropicalis]|uniref:Uncharacterized protein n=1 Tax=Chitinophaga tropicalis TaxID=2683588 RepID=A0A7K1U068_9BACT|nr:hypothetical protein [Chitinophaga tropicalis]MVT07696.1 hypothetical protein [Chitinophaga tropicalis]